MFPCSADSEETQSYTKYFICTFCFVPVKWDMTLIVTVLGIPSNVFRYHFMIYTVKSFC